jgi:hypothetical protein
MKSTLSPYNEKPEPFLDAEPSARLAKVVGRVNERPPPPANEAGTTPQRRWARLLEAFYYWVQSRS